MMSMIMTSIIEFILIYEIVKILLLLDDKKFTSVKAGQLVNY